MAGKFELYQDKGGKFRFRLKAGNGQIILASNAYADKTSAQDAIKQAQSCAKKDGCFERKEAQNGHAIFNLTDGAGHVLGKSEQYSSNSACENGIASVKKNAPDARVEEDVAA